VVVGQLAAGKGEASQRKAEAAADRDPDRDQSRLAITSSAMGEQNNPYIDTGFLVTGFFGHQIPLT
jgi:hypothetical protein